MAFVHDEADRQHKAKRESVLMENQTRKKYEVPTAETGTQGAE